MKKLIEIEFMNDFMPPKEFSPEKDSKCRECPFYVWDDFPYYCKLREWYKFGRPIGDRSCPIRKYFDNPTDSIEETSITKEDNENAPKDFHNKIEHVLRESEEQYFKEKKKILAKVLDQHREERKLRKEQLKGTFKTTNSIHEPIVSKEDWEKVQKKIKDKESSMNKKSVVIYARESNHAGANESLEKQKERLKAFCEDYGYVVADEVSAIGNRQDSLNALKEAIELSKNTGSKTLFMASTNRVVGTRDELTAVTELIESAGVTIATMDGEFEYIQKYGIEPSALFAITTETTDEE